MIATAAIVSTGDELTTGRIVDSNGTWIADKLFEIGIDVVCMLTVGDWPDRLEWAWREAMGRADVVISTGGIGPTADDLTTETVARVAGVPLVLDAASAERIRGFFAAAGREMPENNLKQARVPAGATIIENRLGTAPGYRLRAGATWLVVLPGVPREMKPMVEEQVLPWLRAERGGEVYAARVFQTFGITESGLDELVAGLVDPAEARVSFRASFPEISLRLVVRGAPAEAERRLDALAARVRERLGPYCYGEGAVTMEEAAGRALAAAGLTVSVAESCTGGLVGHRLTNVPGSSGWVRGGVVAYADAVKTDLLGVPAETLTRHGAVSVETAAAMAAGVRTRLGADLGIATTGVAGPGGGTPEKPVGTVCVGLANARGVRTHRYQLWGTRDWVKLLASQLALDWLRREGLGLAMPDAAILGRR